MACLNYRPSVVHFKKGQGVHLRREAAGFFNSGGTEIFSLSPTPFPKVGFGVYVSVQFRDGKLRISVVWVKKVGQKSNEKKRPQEVFG